MMHKTMDDLRAMEADNIIKGSRQHLHHFGCCDLYDLQQKGGDVYSLGPSVVHSD
jgi:hypothetical protein